MQHGAGSPTRSHGDARRPPHEAAVTAALGRPMVAFQGELGAYGDEAITIRWRGAAVPMPANCFEDVVTAVASGNADYGVLPVWNTIVGDITPGLTALRLALAPDCGLGLAGDVHVVVRHYLLAIPGVPLEDIELVASHPVALAQCGSFLANNPRLIPRAVYDTAGAARDLSVERTPRTAAIASRGAAELYGLAVLAADVQDVSDNVTRFLVLERPPATRFDICADVCTLEPR